MAVKKEPICPLFMDDSELPVVMVYSSDKELFPFKKAGAEMSEVLSAIIQDVDTDKGVKIQNVDGKILAVVIRYCEFHAKWDPWVAHLQSEVKKFAAKNHRFHGEVGQNTESQYFSDWWMDDVLNSSLKAATTDVSNFNERFIKENEPILLDLFMAADYLVIPSLLELTCDAFEVPKGVSRDQMRELLIEKFGSSRG